MRTAEVQGLCPDSACGADVGIPADRVLRLPRLPHFDLLNSPLVHAQLRSWPA